MVDGDEWLYFHHPQEIVLSNNIADIPTILKKVEHHIQQGKYAAGFVCYESAAAFASIYPVHKSVETLPLIWFMLCDSPTRLTHPPPNDDAHIVGQWHRSIDYAHYARAMRHIKDNLHAGEVYQVNYTYAMWAKFHGRPYAWFADLLPTQPSPWVFFAETDEWAICSLSPECFFSQKGTELTAKPMKGTYPNDADHCANHLHQNSKEVAENLMIVDVMRNDFSRLPQIHQVVAHPLLRVETYPTVLQMTSTIRAQTDSGLSDVFAALFPPASVTGAPKIAAMRLIHHLETQPRGIYCGSCGWAHADTSRFNVAIRTAVIDKQKQSIRYSIGSGITADSVTEKEWQECEQKFVMVRIPSQPLLRETMRVECGTIPLLNDHLDRLLSSARVLDFAATRINIVRAIEQALQRKRKQEPQRLHLSVTTEGVCQITFSPHRGQEIVKALPINMPTFPHQLTIHKSNRRMRYVEALRCAKQHGCDDAVLINPAQEVTETCIANIVVDIEGTLYTPAAQCGLLPGLLRTSLLKQGKLVERRLHLSDIIVAQELYRINAVRGMEKIILTHQFPLNIDPFAHPAMALRLQ